MSMEIKDLKGLYYKLVDKGLVDKPLKQTSKAEFEQLVGILREHVFDEDIPHYHGKGNLSIPFFAPAKYRYWERNLSDKEKYELFLEMGVPEEDMHYFMYQRSIDVAIGKTDKMGRKVL